MKPYFQDGGVTIYCGDCAEILPSLSSIDLVMTDPPYGMSFRSNHRMAKHDAIVGDDVLPLDLINIAIAKPTRAAYICCRWDNLAAMQKPRSVIAWVKNNWSMGDLEHEHGRQWEAVCFYPRLGHEFVKRIPDVIFADRTGNELHPTQKPERLWGGLIKANVGDVICDPFMGSGSTLLAARALGRIGIGIEIEEKHCEIAAKRFAQSVLAF